MIERFTQLTGYTKPEVRHVPELSRGRGLGISDAHILPQFIDAIDYPRLEIYMYLAGQADHIVLNGDLVNRLADYPLIMKTPWRNFFHVLSTKETYLNWGNHDKGTPPVDRFWKSVQEAVAFNRWGRQIVIMHGHQFDQSKHMEFLETPVGRVLKPAYEKFEEWLIRSRPGSVLQYWAETKPTRRHREIAKFINPRTETLLLGHTHNGFYDPELGIGESGYSNADRMSWFSWDDNDLRYRGEWIHKMNVNNPVTTTLADFFLERERRRGRADRRQR